MTGLGSQRAARLSCPDKTQRKSGALFKELLLSERRSVCVVILRVVGFVW